MNTKFARPILITGFALMAFACDNGRERREGNSGSNAVQCNPGCPTGQHCVAGTNGAPNECIADSTTGGTGGGIGGGGIGGGGTGGGGTGGGTSGGTGQIGAACTDAARDCATPYCATAEGQTTGFCTTDCTGTGQGSCPSGYACTPAGSISVCAPSSGPGPGPGPGPGSELTCSGIIDCLNQCAQGDNACGQACYDNGNTEAKAQFDALLSCVQQTQCSFQDNTCQQQCATQIDSCLGGTSGGGGNPPPPPPPPTGSLTCTQLNDCVGQCQDQACADMCVQQSDQQSVDLLLAVYNCIDQTGCQAEACNEACGSQINACVADQ
jgi:hypothetical protein